MKKRNISKILSRPKNQRKALMKSLVTGLIEHKQITTTLAKAKAIKPIAEKLISLAIKSLEDNQKLTKIRLLRKKLCQKAVVQLIEIAGIIKNRRGGYLKIIKLPVRKSDFAQMAKIQWVDEEVKEKKEERKKEKKEKDKKENDKK